MSRGEATWEIWAQIGDNSKVVWKSGSVIGQLIRIWSLLNETGVLLDFVWLSEWQRCPSALTDSYFLNELHIIALTGKRLILVIFSPGATGPSGPGSPHYEGFTITLGRTPLDEWSARRRDLYLQHTTLTRDRHSCPRRDSNPRSQQASSCWHTP